ncbi:MAG: (2Fe-2S) ferredoxin domain-containing protein [Calothrix sp. MO_167.B42]|nr:(2Fe-2S) ferredoxin domain-containing protein [Calothrix sp. MO_167.B42]
MGKKYLKLSEFTIEGKFLGLLSNKRQKNSHLQLQIESGDVEIKLPKNLRPQTSEDLMIGGDIRVLGVSKLHTKTRKIKLKAHQILSISDDNHQQQINPVNKAKILVCQKSSCRKRGGKGFLSEIEKTLCDRGLKELVDIEHTGCLKHCHGAPSCVFQVGKKQYKKMHPEAIVKILLQEKNSHSSPETNHCSKNNIS